MPNSVATDFYDTFANWALGNEGVVNAFQSLIDIGLSTLNAQQNNPYCEYKNDFFLLFLCLIIKNLFFFKYIAQYVLGVVFKFFEQNLAIHQTITNTIKQTVSSGTPSSSSSTYTVKVDTEVESIISSANTMSNQFMQLAAICTELESAIVNPPPISSNEST